MPSPKGPIGVSIQEIDRELRPASQIRAGLDHEFVERYTEKYAKLPPIVLMFDRETKTHWVADGCHRLTAAIALKQKDVSAIIIEGSYDDAWDYATDANEEHGIPITNSDRRHRVEFALKHPVWSTWSNRRIADKCKVSATLVRTIRPESGALKAQLNDQPKITGKDGKQYPARKPPKPRSPKPIEPDEPDEPVTATPPPPVVVGNGKAKAAPNPVAVVAVQVQEPEPEPTPQSAPVIIKPQSQEFISAIEFGVVKEFIANELERWPEKKRGDFAFYLTNLGKRLCRKFNVEIQEVQIEVNAG